MHQTLEPAQKNCSKKLCKEGGVQKRKHQKAAALLKTTGIYKSLVMTYTQSPCQGPGVRALQEGMRHVGSTASKTNLFKQQQQCC